MNYEQKYKEALNKIKPLYEQAKRDGNPIWSTYEYLIPELSESEDERIRKALIPVVDRLLGTINFPFTEEQVLNWFEKQKEQKPAYTAKERWKEMRLEVYAQASGNRHEPNYSDDSTKMFSLCDIDEIFEKIGDSTIGSQPAEWSEEDEEIVGLIKKVLYDCKNGTEHMIGDKEYSKCIAWLESNLGCFGEINDEALEEQYEIWIEKGRCSGRDEVIFHPEKFGLCKPTEWGEEDELMRTAVIQTLKMFGGRGTTEMQIDWLKSLRPQSHWKPSEEQLDALREASVGWMNEEMGNAKILKSLYEQLKAL